MHWIIGCTLADRFTLILVTTSGIIAKPHMQIDTSTSDENERQEVDLDENFSDNDSTPPCSEKTFLISTDLFSSQFVVPPLSRTNVHGLKSSRTDQFLSSKSLPHPPQTKESRTEPKIVPSEPRLPLIFIFHLTTSPYR